MKRDKYLGIFFALGVLLGGLSFTFLAQLRHLPVIAQTNNTPSRTKTAIARFWQGRTLTSKADEYYAYLMEAGIKKIESIPGNLGVQVFRRTNGNITVFTVISYWESLDAIRKFAGNDIEKTRHLP